MPFIRSLALKCCIFFTTSISFNKEIISLYSYYIKKGLVYIIIISPFSRQPFLYLEYMKANTRLLYDVHLISLNKYIFPYYYTHFYARYSLLIP